jgi:Uma2 family endonuclease
MAVAPKPLTLEYFLQLPEEEPALEFAEAMVTQKVSPKGRQSALQVELAERFNQAARPLKLARAFTELRTTFAGVSRVPDLVVYRWQRIPIDAEGRLANDFQDPPDIAVEIASPEQSVNQLVRRCLWYVAHGVTLALLVDPVDESVLLFRPGQTPIGLQGAERIDVSEVLPGFDLTVEELFASLKMR